MKPATIHKVLEQYGYSADKLYDPFSGYRNTSYRADVGDKSLNVIIYKDEPGIVQRIYRTNWLGEYLSGRGLPVRYPLDDRILTLHAPRLRYAVLYNYLPGTTIAWEAYTKKHIKLQGWAMASLHNYLRAVPDTSDGKTSDFTPALGAFPVLCDEYSAITDRMLAYFAQPGVVSSIGQKLGVEQSKPVLGNLKQFLTACQKLPSQLLHMDFVRGNVLFCKTGSYGQQSAFYIDDISLSGVIDFEKAALGHPLFDCARSLAFLYVDCSNKSAAQINRYFIESGYRKRGQNELKPLSVECANGMKYDVLQTAITLFLYYDWYKLLRANPYESLAGNYHYRRTTEQLMKRGVLSQRTS